MTGSTLKISYILGGTSQIALGHLRETHHDQSTPNSSSMFYNYKGYFSINLMVLVDADYCFIHVDVGNYDNNGDSGVFKASALGQAFMEGNLHVPAPKELVRYPQGVLSFATLYCGR